MRSKLINLRKGKNITQEIAAKELRISRAYYGRIETGERTPSLAVAFRIKKFYNYYDDDIFFIEERDKVAR